jgi:hypothetical protein
MENRSKLELAKVKVLEGALYKAKLMAELDHLNNKLDTHEENYDTVVEYSSKDDNAMNISYGSGNNDEAVHGQFNNEENSKCSENCLATKQQYLVQFSIVFGPGPSLPST